MLEFETTKRLKPGQEITVSLTPEELVLLVTLLGNGRSSGCGLYGKLWKKLVPEHWRIHALTTAVQKLCGISAATYTLDNPAQITKLIEEHL